MGRLLKSSTLSDRIAVINLGNDFEGFLQRYWYRGPIKKKKNKKNKKKKKQASLYVLIWSDRLRR